MALATNPVQSEVRYYYTQEFKDTLIEQLAKFPPEFQLVPIKEGWKEEKGEKLGWKAPIGEKWQTRQIDRSEIRQAIEGGQAWGFGLKLGVAGSGILAIDVDGTHAKNGFESILAGCQLPKTVVMTSGKPDRCQYLFMVPQDLWGGLERKATKFGNEDLDFRWSYNYTDSNEQDGHKGFQSCLPSTFHSIEYGTYQWVEGCSPEDTKIAQLPDLLLNFWLELINPPKVTGTNTREPKTSATPSLPSKKNNGDFDRMLKAAVTEVACHTEGDRNTNLNKVAGTLAGISGNDPEKVEAIRSALTAAALQSGLPESDITGTINSGISWGIAHPIAPYGSGELTKLQPIEVADLLVQNVLANLKFDTEAGQWWEYDHKGKWFPVKQARVFKLSQDYLRDKVKITTVNYLNDCIKFAQSHVQVDGWSEVSSLLFIPFTNGVLDIKANQFGSHSPDYGFTWQLPRAYDPLATDCTQIDRFLDTLSNNNPELKQVAIAYCSAVLKGMSDLHLFLYLFGSSGGNGKSTYMTLLSMLIGKENRYSTSLAELEGNRFESANLKGKRLVLMTDEDKQCGSIKNFKKATGGDPIRYERKGCDASNFMFNGLFVLAANSPTFVGNRDGGLDRRIISFPCNAQIAVADRKNMEPLFDSELTAFTSYLLALDETWVVNTLRGAKNIAAIKQQGKELAICEDSIAAFADAVELVPCETATVRGTYLVYVRFCDLNGLKPKSAIRFIPEFIGHCKAEGIEVANKRDMNGKYLKGLQIQIPAEYQVS